MHRMKQITRRKVRDLKPPAHGRRTGDAGTEELAASLEAHGLLQPIVIRQDGEVIVGEQRRRSADPDAEVDVIVVDVDDVEALEMRLSDELSKTEVSAVARAEMVAELATLLAEQGEKPSADRLAEIVGTAPRTIKRYLRMADLPKGVKKLVDDGQVGYREAEALSEASGLEAKEKTALAKKFASGRAPGGVHARDVVGFAEKAPPKVRERFVRSSRTSYDEAKRAADRSKSREYREWLANQTAMRARPFFMKVIEKLRAWTPAVRDVAELATFVPEEERPALREALHGLRDACDAAIVAVDGGASSQPSPRALESALERAEGDLAATSQQ